MKKLGLFLFVSACLTSPAWAGSAPYSATLAKPLSAPKEVIADSTLFKCADTTCVSASKPINAGSTFACHALVRSVGEVTAYGTASNQFDADKLKACNSD